MAEAAKELDAQTMLVNMGPSHPAMHGTIKLVLELDGETIVNMIPHIGYLHRGFEKMCENSTYKQCIPYTDRLSYVCPVINNTGFILTVEKLLGIKDPERSQYIRVIGCEINRLMDHITCVAAGAMEIGAFSVFLYAMEARDELMDLLEMMPGARLTSSITRIGGVKRDLPEGFIPRAHKALDKHLEALDVMDRLLTKNRIFIDRCTGVGAITKEDAVSFGFTGPCLRSTGIDYDVRKAMPYLVYDRFDFDIPVGINGDVFDRYLIRMEEMRQSVLILRQALDQIPNGPYIIDDPKVTLPPKEKVYNSLEGTVSHFKLIMDGAQIPASEAYGYVEAGNGELGFYIVSDGTGQPYKCRCRPPCFYLMQAVPYLCNGHIVSDIIAVFGSINMVGGECDR